MKVTALVIFGVILVFGSSEAYRQRNHQSVLIGENGPSSAPNGARSHSMDYTRQKRFVLVDKPLGPVDSQRDGPALSTLGNARPRPRAHVHRHPLIAQHHNVEKRLATFNRPSATGHSMQDGIGFVPKLINRPMIVDHYQRRQKRFTCDLFTIGIKGYSGAQHAACAAKCVGQRHLGGHCDGTTCKCVEKKW